jgi:hypothetical protein
MSPEMPYYFVLSILTLGESEAVVLCKQGEEHYVGTLLH